MSSFRAPLPPSKTTTSDFTASAKTPTPTPTQKEPPLTTTTDLSITLGDSRGELGRLKVTLPKGCSPLDWVRYKANTTKPEASKLRKITMEEVAKHSTVHDAWAVIHDKVYNITPYIKFHPGGPEQILRAAGKDGTKLFNYYHRWVKADALLDSCLLGSLAS